MGVKKGVMRAALCLMMCLAMLATGVSFAAAVVTLDVQVPVKQIFSKTGTDLSVSEQFSYILTPQDAASPLPEGSAGGKYVFSMTGNVEQFFKIRYLHAGEYIYQLAADASHPQKGYTYDPEIYTVKVYAKNYNNSLISEVIIQNTKNDKLASAVFTNSYQPLASDPAIMVDPPVRKTVQGNPPSSSVFTFVLKAGDPGYPMPAGSSNGIKKLSVTGSGTGEFGTWSYTKTGTYTYTVYEENTGAAGYAYDTKVYTIRDVITDVNGQLTQSRSVIYGQQSATEYAFVNTYTAPDDGGGAAAAHSPKTGDPGQLGLWLALLAAAACGLILLAVLFRRKKKQEEPEKTDTACGGESDALSRQKAPDGAQSKASAPEDAGGEDDLLK